MLTMGVRPVQSVASKKTNAKQAYAGSGEGGAFASVLRHHLGPAGAAPVPQGRQDGFAQKQFGNGPGGDPEHAALQIVQHQVLRTNEEILHMLTTSKS